MNSKAQLANGLITPPAPRDIFGTGVDRWSEDAPLNTVLVFDKPVFPKVQRLWRILVTLVLAHNVVESPLPTIKHFAAHVGPGAQIRKGHGRQCQSWIFLHPNLGQAPIIRVHLFWNKNSEAVIQFKNCATTYDGSLTNLIDNRHSAIASTSNTITAIAS
ncbi:MAG: hypothetical protein WC028_02750 [Candidatus Obscuribacterales bacterium]